MHDCDHILLYALSKLFFLTHRSTLGHSSGRYFFRIQDHILVRHLCTYSFFCNHRNTWVYLWSLFLLTSFVFRELGRQRSTIELDTPSVKPAQLQALEEAVNEKIRAHVPVTVQLLSIDDPAVEKVHMLILNSLVLKCSPFTVRSMTQKSSHLTREREMLHKQNCM